VRGTRFRPHRRSGDGGEGGDGESSGSGSIRARNWGKEERGEKRWEEGMPGHPFIGLEGERGSRATKGNGRRWWCTMMVVEAAVLGGDRPGRWWGVMRGGVLRSFWEQKGGAGRWHARARESAVAALAIRPGEEDDRAGPMCR
jgi:hypothetical protein